MIRTKLYLILAVFAILMIACNDDLKPGDKYARPDWLAGKVFTQLKTQPELSTFAKCIEITGYDTIIDVSGSYTVFAPNDDAFISYFQGNPDYSKVEDIPIAELTSLVKYHIVQNPWSKSQLRQLDVYGWIDSLDLLNNEPRGFKRETLLLDKNRNYGIDSDKILGFYIVDTTASNWHRKVATDSRKYVPIFFEEYFDIYGLSLSDYEFYFNRSFSNPSDLYFAGGRIIGDEIFAENGFVYNIDRVIEPLKNAYQILSDESSGNSYTDFLELINFYPEFEYDENKTFDQPGADKGLEVDSLFNLSFPELTFNISNEKTKAPSGSLGLPSNVTIRYHHGMAVPTNEAFASFVNEYLVGGTKWGNLEKAPVNIKRMIANTHLSINPIFPTDFRNGYFNGEDDRVVLDEGNIIQKEFGSNCSFIGLNKAIVPRAFSSVAGPVYINKGYSFVMYGIEKSGLLSALKRENQDYSFFVESDDNCRLDSSFLYAPITETFSAFQISGAGSERTVIDVSALRRLLLNHIGIEKPNGSARKEFIKNLAGNYLVFNNETGEVSGTDFTTYRYKGSIRAPEFPEQISINADNGITYDIDNWFSFKTSIIYTLISTSYPKFHSLLVKAGLADVKTYKYKFMSDNENYTVFVPHDTVLQNFQADTITKNLEGFLLMHFVQGDIIFTDGNKPSGYYETVRKDVSETAIPGDYVKIYIETDYDEIIIRDKSGTPFYTITESPVANLLTGRLLGDGSEAFPNIINTGVVHEINKILIYDELDTQD